MRRSTITSLIAALAIAFAAAPSASAQPVDARPAKAVPASAAPAREAPIALRVAVGVALLGVGAGIYAYRRRNTSRAPAFTC